MWRYIIFAVGAVITFVLWPSGELSGMVRHPPITSSLIESDAHGNPITIVSVSVSDGIKIAVSPRTDTNLALVYAVYDLYGQFPPGGASPDEQSRAIERLCAKANEYKALIDARHLDGEMSSLFDDYIAVASALTTYRDMTGAVKNGSISQAQKDQFETAFNAGYTGSAAAAKINAIGGSGAEVALGGLAIGLFKYLMEEDQRTKARDSAQSAAINSLNEKWMSFISEMDKRLGMTTGSIAVRHGWDEAELPIGDLPEEEEALNVLINGKPSTTATLIMERRSLQRPRDALMLAKFDNLKAYDSKLSPLQKVELAKQCISRAALLPADPVFDVTRARIFMLAGDISNMAWTQDLTGKVWHKTGSQIAAFSIQIWDTALRLAPLDLTGECRERRAWSLLATGKIDDAVIQADEVKPIVGNQSRFMYNYAMAKSAQGNQVEAFSWFSYGVQSHGFSMIQRAHDDKNMERMKAEIGGEYKELTKVKTTWVITYGVINDDITLKNESSYALTNVTLSCSLVQGGKTWSPELRSDFIGPGQKVVWRDCVSIPGSRLDSKSAALDCDQYHMLPEVSR